MKGPHKEKVDNDLGPFYSLSKDAVKAKFRELALVHHPDRGGDPEKFIELVAARDAALAETGDDCILDMIDG